MKSILTIFGLLITFLSHSQANNDTIKVITKLIESGVGSKIHIATYKVLKVLKESVTNDTIDVGYYFYNEIKNEPDSALLTLTTYTGSSITKDYYIFPKYDQKNAISKVRVSTIEFEYWENCETGKEKCKPLTLTRSSAAENWFLIMPCGGTETMVTLTALGQKGPIKKINIRHTDCPPVFDLRDLPDGKYYAYMLACGLGGQIEINLRTK